MATCCSRLRRAALRCVCAVLVDVAQLGLELVDATDEAAAVDLELGLARAPGADAAAPAGCESLRPCPAQAGQPVAQLGQLDLGLALLAVGVLGEDVEDHRGAVDGGAPEQLLEVELLRRASARRRTRRCRSRRVERDLAQLVGLALADVGGRVGRSRRCTTRATSSAPAVSTSRRQLVERRSTSSVCGAVERDADEARARLAGARSGDEGVGRVASFTSAIDVDRGDVDDRDASSCDGGRRARCRSGPPGLAAPDTRPSRRAPSRCGRGGGGAGARAAGLGEADAALVHPHRELAAARGRRR